MSREQKSGCAARWITDDFAQTRIHTSDNGLDQGARSEILACPALGVACILLKQPLVRVPFQIIG